MAKIPVAVFGISPIGPMAASIREIMIMPKIRKKMLEYWGIGIGMAYTIKILRIAKGPLARAPKPVLSSGS